MQHARRLGLVSALVAGIAVVAAPALAAPASSQQASPSVQLAAKTGKSSRGTCANDTELAALNARVVQTELMVAALSCEERTRYNEFATSFQSVLVGRADDLRNFFQRTNGKQGTTRMNAMVTRLANDASQQSQMRADTYCQFASDLFEEVLKTPAASFNTVVDKPWIRARHGVTACSSSTAAR
jgi:hypothetical protein